MKYKKKPVIIEAIQFETQLKEFVSFLSLWEECM